MNALLLIKFTEKSVQISSAMMFEKEYERQDSHLSSITNIKIRIEIRIKQFPRYIPL